MTSRIEDTRAVYPQGMEDWLDNTVPATTDTGFVWRTQVVQDQEIPSDTRVNARYTTGNSQRIEEWLDYWVSTGQNPTTMGPRWESSKRVLVDQDAPLVVLMNARLAKTDVDSQHVGTWLDHWPQTRRLLAMTENTPTWVEQTPWDQHASPWLVTTPQRRYAPEWLGPPDTNYRRMA